MLKDLAKDIAGTFAGVVGAAALVVCAFGLYLLCARLFPAIVTGVPWPEWLIVFFLPEMVFLVFAVKLWNNRRSVSVGVALAAAIFCTHYAAHLVSHWRG